MCVFVCVFVCVCVCVCLSGWATVYSQVVVLSITITLTYVICSYSSSLTTPGGGLGKRITRHLIPICLNSGPHRSLGSRIWLSRRCWFGRGLLPEAAGLLPGHGEPPPRASHALSGSWRRCPVAMGTKSEKLRAGESDGHPRAQRWFWKCRGNIWSVFKLYSAFLVLNTTQSALQNRITFY